MKTLILCVLLTAPVLADDLIYSSQTLSGTATNTDGSQVDSSPANDVYTVTVNLSGPLAPNLKMAMVTPQSWAVACQNCEEALSSSPTANVSPPLVYMVATAAVFMFSTDATGKITDWNFAISGNSTVSSIGTNGDGSTEVDDSSENSGSFGSGFDSGDTATSTQFSSVHRNTLMTSGPRGTWTQSSLANPAPAAPATPTTKMQPQVRLWFRRL